MSKVIAILGGGNAGQTSAAELSLLGYECRLYQDPDFAGEIKSGPGNRANQAWKGPEGRVPGRGARKSGPRDDRHGGGR